MVEYFNSSNSYTEETNLDGCFVFHIGSYTGFSSDCNTPLLQYFSMPVCCIYRLRSNSSLRGPLAVEAARSQGTNNTKDEYFEQ
jgi:hypothetical protein